MRLDVSVIIPVYNTQDYVAQAITSVLDQSLGNVEIIAVDDGSTDKSLDVLKSFGGRIRIITKPNSGQADARNIALEAASGEFVYFMDSDDTIAPDTLKCCVERCRKDNLDFVFFDAVSFGADFNPASSPWFDYHRSAPYTTVSDGCTIMSDMLSRGLYRCSVCMCLYRRDFIGNLRFPSGILHEDEYFSAAAFLKASRTEGIPQEFYHRRLREDSVMTKTFSTRNVEGYLSTLRLVKTLGTDRRKKAVVRQLSKAFVLSLMHNSWNLPLRVRLGIASEILFRYPYAFAPAPFASLLFKKLVN
ncbi:MAG: glycosyltransferase family 2 protein [Candidatus Cryptobacteroides sp.]